MAQDLLDEGTDKIWLLPEFLLQKGVAQQGLDGAADQVRGGLQACHDQQQTDVDPFVEREARRSFLEGPYDQGRAFRLEAGEVFPEDPPIVWDLIGRPRPELIRIQDGFHPCLQPGGVRSRKTQHQTHDGQRQGDRQFSDDVTGPDGGQSVQGLGHAQQDGLLQLPDSGR